MKTFAIQHKNPPGSQYQYSRVGSLTRGDWENISVNVERMRAVLAQAEQEGLQYIKLYISKYEDKKSDDEPNAPQQFTRNSTVRGGSSGSASERPSMPHELAFDDEIPF